IAILAAMLLPALARAKARAEGISCLSNMKQLQLAWILYADDYQGRFPLNPDGAGVRQGESSAKPAWVAGWLSMSSNPDNTNTLKLIGPEYAQFGSLGPYSRSAGIYHCPSDKTIDPGTGILRVRSASMNGYIGPTRDGGISDGYLDGPNESYTKDGSFKRLKPSEAMVFLDERPEQLNDGWFRSPTTLYNVQDLPAINHGNNSSAFSFADGHAELHKWRDPRFIGLTQGGAVLAGSADAKWLWEHSTRRK
ncbi:MAG TPA: hypothetical protein PKH32_13635, partial [Verrucomicrobiota bacterium]|nr:hypothetical protein [Verrucomicrobiota bacterium]